MSWLDSREVLAVLGADLAEAVDDQALQAYCDGAREFVEDRKPGIVADGATPSKAVVLGAAMLAYRLYSRRTSPLGVIGFTEDGAAGIMRDDPDIGRLLGLGRYGRFVFGGAAGIPPVPVEVV